MAAIATPLADLILIDPIPSEHAPHTLRWFESDYGHETLLLMGNAEHEIETATLESEMKTLEEFVKLQEENEQITWMIQFQDKLIGVAWIELIANHGVKPPSVHLMIGDKSYRGRGIGTTVMQTLIRYIHQNLDAPVIYSRHLKSNTAVAAMNRRLGFKADAAPYVDANGLDWQNVRLSLDEQTSVGN